MAQSKASSIKLPFRITVIVFVTIALIGMLLRLCGVDKDDKVIKIEQSLQQLRASLDGESIRQYTIQKVMHIISQYNTEMSSSMRYDIANELFVIDVNYANVDADLLCAIITRETAGSWDPEFVSDSGDMGLMQILPALGVFVARYDNISWLTPEEVLLDPVYNIRIGARYLSTLIENYDVDGGLIAYHCGVKMAARWVKSGRRNNLLSSDAREYLPAVLALYQQFQHM